MSYQKIIYLGLVIFLLCIGCGLKEGVVQKEPKSFLWFTGNTKDAIVYIDDLSPIILKENQAKIHYEISPGKHSIVVKKMGEEVINRIVLFGNGITKEIEIP
jgi:hypothetical protein